MGDRNRHAATILDAWASCIRSDWGTIDGRTCRDELNKISDYLQGALDTLTLWDVGVCIGGRGGPHWAFSSSGDHECDPSIATDAEAPDA